MAFEIRPYPEFSWSISRQRLLDQCPRKYFYRYYRSWNGWLRDAPDGSQQAYRLSKLTSLHALFGQEMDERARELEAVARAGLPLPSAHELGERTRASLRAAWRSSRDDRAAFEARPKEHVMLRSFYLEDAAPAAEETDRLNGKLTSCLENLVRVGHWERLAQCASTGYVAIPPFAHFVLDGVKVHAAADLAYVHQGVLHIVDWKSGRAGEDDHVQVTLATHCLRQTEPSIASLACHPVLEYLKSGEQRAVALAQYLEAEVGAIVQAGIVKMQRHLRDVERNAPLEEGDFERQESGLCQSCNFTSLCGRH